MPRVFSCISRLNLEKTETPKNAKAKDIRFIFRLRPSYLIRRVTMTNTPFPVNPLVIDLGYGHDTNRAFRPTNEDSAVAGRRLIFRESEIDLFLAVYDGHGGREAVEIAEVLVHRCMAEVFRRQTQYEPIEGDEVFKEIAWTGMKSAHHDKVIKLNWNRVPRDVIDSKPMVYNLPDWNAIDVPTAVKTAFACTDSFIARECPATAGCTAVIIYMRVENGQRILYTANAGDARAVLVRNGRPIRLTKDHRPEDPQEITRIRNAGGFILQGRVNGVLNITRALGDHYNKNVIISTPHQTRHVLTDEDTAIVIACDGLWDVVSEDLVARIVAQDFARNHDSTCVAKKLVNNALGLGSQDNVTILVAKLPKAWESN